MAKAEKPWPAFEVERRALASLKPYKGNARTHSEAQIAQIAASIREWGWTTPVLVDETGELIAGHARLAAARQIGVAEVPVVVARGWSAAQKRAYVLADNQLTLNAGWDEDLLRVEIGALGEMDFDLGLIGFGDAFLADLMADRTAGLTDPDEAPEPPVNPVTRPGDIWLCGRHRVLCGDATKAEDVGRVTDAAEANLCFTSPPYAQQRDYGQCPISDWDALMQGVFSNLRMASDGQVLVNLGLVHRDSEWQPYWDGWIEWMRSIGWRRFGWYVWDQGPGLPGDWNGRLAPSHEFIFHFNRTSRRANKTKASKWAGHPNHGSGLRAKDGTVSGYSHAGRPVQAKKIADSVFRVMRHKARGIEMTHPAVFPVGLVQEILQAYSTPSDAVYDPFLGSGTTMIAAEMEGRSCIGLEISSAYCDVIVQRWQAFTGKAATLDGGDGRTFEAIDTERFNGECDRDGAGSYDEAIRAKRERLHVAAQPQ